MSKAALALAYARNALGSAYVYGGTGRPCTPAYRLARARQYPAMAAAIRKSCRLLSGRADSCRGCRYQGCLVYDCAQLVKLSLAAAGIRLPSGASSQWKDDKAWAWQGVITNLAAEHPCVLFRAEAAGSPQRPMAHVGLSLGRGWAVDARNHQAGVIKTRLTAYPWTHMAFPQGFALPPGLKRMGEEPVPDPAAPVPAQRPRIDAGRMRETSLGQGDRGGLVSALQGRLLMLGYPLPRYGQDGIFGPETARALVAFQRVAGLAPTGRADPETMHKLFPLHLADKPPDDEWGAYESEEYE